MPSLQALSPLGLFFLKPRSTIRAFVVVGTGFDGGTRRLDEPSRLECFSGLPALIESKSRLY